MNRVACLLIVFCVASLNAVAQGESGTIVALNSSQNEIVVAADSRSTSGSWHFDNRCKITALGNELIFAASNYTESATIDKATGRILHVQWDAHAVARKEFLRLSHEGVAYNLPIKLAQAWGRDVTKAIEQAMTRNRASVVSMLDGDVVTAAIFAGFDRGKPLLVTAKIICGGGNKSLIKFEITDINRSPRAIFIGNDTIPHEFVADQTRRAKTWNQKAAIQARYISDPVAFYPNYWVGLAIRYDLGEFFNGRLVHELGDPIDAVRLRQGRGIEWIRRKSNCPPN